MRSPTYLVATDLSPPSRVGLYAATALARRTGASVELFCAVPASILDEERKLLTRVRDGLGRLAEEATADGVATRGEASVARDVPRAVVERAEELRAELVVVGPSGVTGWRKFVLGSVTERLLRLAPSMLLVARGKTASAPPARILAAIDMTSGSSRAFRVAIDLAKACGAKVTALHVVAPPGAALLAASDVYLPETWTLEAERVATAQREFGRWVREFPKNGVEIEARVVEGNAAETISAEAEAAGADMVVVGSHGKTAVHEFFVGSVARAVATHCTMSVLVVRARPVSRRSQEKPRKAARAKPARGKK
jgi:nucleotide-binding universal stress UspA family protein